MTSRQSARDCTGLSVSPATRTPRSRSSRRLKDGEEGTCSKPNEKRRKTRRGKARIERRKEKEKKKRRSRLAEKTEEQRELQREREREGVAYRRMKRRKGGGIRGNEVSEFLTVDLHGCYCAAVSTSRRKGKKTSRQTGGGLSRLRVSENQ